MLTPPPTSPPLRLRARLKRPSRHDAQQLNNFLLLSPALLCGRPGNRKAAAARRSLGCATRLGYRRRRKPPLAFFPLMPCGPVGCMGVEASKAQLHPAESRIRRLPRDLPPRGQPPDQSRSLPARARQEMLLFGSTTPAVWRSCPPRRHREKDGHEEPHLYVDDADGLVTWVQIGMIEFHGWVHASKMWKRLIA